MKASFYLIALSVSKKNESFSSRFVAYEFDIDLEISGILVISFKRDD